MDLSSNYLIKQENVISELRGIQRQICKNNCYLSASLGNSMICLNDYEEGHLKIELMNYPIKNENLDVFENHIYSVVEHLMVKFNQNRVIIEFKSKFVEMGISEVKAKAIA